MNSDKLISIDDADLDLVAGGLGLGVQVNDKTLAGVDVSKKGVTVTLFGFSLTLGLKFGR